MRFLIPRENVFPSHSVSHSEEEERDHVGPFHTCLCHDVAAISSFYKPHEGIILNVAAAAAAWRLNERSGDARGQHVTHGGGVVYSKAVLRSRSPIKTSNMSISGHGRLISFSRFVIWADYDIVITLCGYSVKKWQIHAIILGAEHLN